MKKKELQEAAKELNEVLVLEPVIDVEEDTAALEKDITDVIPLIEEDDELTIPTTNIIKMLTEPKEEEVEPENVEVKEKGKDKGATTKKIVEKKSDKPTRAMVMAQICQTMKKKAYTKKEIIEKMQAQYGGSLAEATFQVSNYLRLLIVLKLVKEDAKGKYTYNA